MESEFIFPPDLENPRGIVIVYPSVEILRELQAIVGFFFCGQVADYMAMSDGEYRHLVLKAQTEIDRRGLAQRLAAHSHSALSRVLSCGKIAVQGAHLRAARPQSPQQIQEAISWHRESFYNLAGAYMVNYWIPLSNVNASTALQYVPNSHTIPDTALKAQLVKDPRISLNQQKIGLLEEVWHIVEGVDLSKAEPMVVLPGEAAIFHGALIHGMGENHSDNIRFSLDFRVYSNHNYEIGKEKERRAKEKAAA